MKSILSKQFITNKNGFTMVELMVVVAILGVLATIAVPQYSRFMAKARQSEAKVALSAIYTAEQSFFVENQTYTGCLATAGYKPQGDKIYYSSGIKDAVTAACGISGTATAPTYSCYGTSYTVGSEPALTCGTGGSGTSFFMANTRAGTKAIVTDASDLPTTTVTNTAFTAGVGGNIMVGRAELDRWTITQAKIINNIESGIK